MTRDDLRRRIWGAATYFAALLICMGFGIWTCARPPYVWRHRDARMSDLERVVREGPLDRDRYTAAALLMQQAVRAIVAIRSVQNAVNFDEIESLLASIRKELR